MCIRDRFYTLFVGFGKLMNHSFGHLGVAMDAFIIFESFGLNFSCPDDRKNDSSVCRTPVSYTHLIRARAEHFKGLIVPEQNAREAAVVNNLEVYGCLLYTSLKS